MKRFFFFGLVFFMGAGLAQAGQVEVVFEDFQVPSFIVVEDNGFYSVEVVEPLFQMGPALFAERCNFVTDCGKKWTNTPSPDISSL